MHAIRGLGAEIDLVAVNHWPVAIATHSRNHPNARHHAVNLDAARPESIVPGGQLDLLMASPECFPAGTLVLTEFGFESIETVKAGTRVLTHSGRWMPVTSVMSSMSDTVRVRGHGHYGLETTREHPFYASQRRMRHRPLDGSRYRFTDPEWVKAGSLAGHYWATPTSVEPLEVPPVSGRGAEFTPDFWWMVGRWLGDGSVRLDERHAELTIACGKHEADGLESRLGFAPATGSRSGPGEYHWRRRDVRTATLFECAHRGLAEWLVAHFGKLAHGKTIPSWAFGMPEADREMLLEGYCSADGWQNSRKREVSTVSKRLALGIRLLAESLGHRVAWHFGKARNNPIEGRQINERDHHHLVWLKDRQHEYGGQGPGVSWLRVKSVENARQNVAVYNLSVAEDESFVAEGVVVHNCTHHSRARGGKPTSDQQRMSAWHINRWASSLDVRCILVENVSEFVGWGPVLPSGQPDPARKGSYFQAWVQSLWAMGYDAEWRVLNAADFGDATTRQRFFLQARKDGCPIRWPEPTHSRTGSSDLFGQLKRWRSAREIIDWSNPGTSIFDRARPLSGNTRRRIARGLQMFCGVLAPLYIRLLDLDPPEPEVVATGTPEPFILANRNHNVPRGGQEPIPALTTATGGGIYLVQPSAEPFVLGQHGGAVARSTDQPLPTITTDGAIGLARPMVVPYYGNGQPASVDAPLPTVTTRDRFSLVMPTAYMVPGFGEAAGQLPRVHSIDAPVPTICTHSPPSLVSPIVVKIDQSGAAWGTGASSVHEPLPTLVTKANLAVACPTIPACSSGVDPRRLVLIDGEPHVLDIRFRMLTNDELARAMGFTDEERAYEFTGTKSEVTKQIGNAVPVRTAAALVTAILGSSTRQEPVA